MGQIIGGAAKPKRCNINQLSQLGTPAAGEYILVSSDNSMNAAGQGNFDCYIVGDGTTAATGLEMKNILGNLGAQTIDVNSNLTIKQWIDANAENNTFGEARSINNNSYYASDFIPVCKGDIITFIAITGSGDSNAKNNGGYVFYDLNKTAVSGVITMVGNWSTATRTIVVPEGIAYFRFSGTADDSTISISRKFENLVVYEKDFADKLSESLLSNKGRDDGYWDVRILTAASVSIENGDVVLSVIAKAGNNIAYYDMSHLEVGVQYRISFDYIATSGRNFDCGFYGTNVGTPIALSNTQTILQNHSDHIFIDFEYSESTKYFGFSFGAAQEPGFTVTISSFSIIKIEQVEHILYLDDIDNSFNGGSSKVLGAEKGKELNKRLFDNEKAVLGYKRLYLEYSSSEKAHTNIYTKMVAKPYEGVKLYFKMPANCRAYLRTSWGIDVHEWTNGAVVLANGDIYTDTELYTHLMIGFYMLDENGNYISNTQYNPVPLLISMLESGEIAVYYKEYGNIIDRNTQAQQDCDALLIRTIGTKNHALSKVMYPIITHISDTHSDVERYKQFMEFSDFIGASVAVHSGDVSAYNNGSGLTYIHALSDQYNTPVTVCVGNHDAGGGGDYELINSVKDDYGYLESSDTITTHTYYYKDFDDIKIRIIALNYYEDGATSVFNITQEQITWFCSTLKSTPSNYGVIVVLHTPEVAVNQAEGYTKFSDGDLPSPSTTSTYPMITDIVDAFISKGSINNTYTPTFKGSQVTITVNDSFSSVAAGVEFICFMTGHYHQDFVGYNNTSQKQLMLNVVSGIPLYTDVDNYTGALGALVRRGKTITQDAFNVYGIDRARKLVHIIRVGARRTRDGVVRDFMSIPYA